MMSTSSSYNEAYAWSLRDPEGFWGEAAKDIDWFEPAKKVFDRDEGVYGRWFTGAIVNTCYNAVDRHVERGLGNSVALIHDSPVTDSVTKLTYAELLDEVKALGAVMQDFGIEKGDRVVVYMPMVLEAVIAMLACARIGAVHSVVFGGFAAKELATRIDDTQPKLILSASCGIEPGRIVKYKPLLDEAISLAQAKPPACIILQRPQHQCELLAGRDHDWRTLKLEAQRHGKAAACVPVLATDPLYILYTSGTTGAPKGIVRDNGGHLVSMKWSMANLYGIKQGDVWWGASDIGWVVGHSYIVYGPLIHGATSVLYEGKPVGTPNAGAFWRVIAEHKVAALFTAPTALRAIRKEDPDGTFLGQFDLSSFRTLFLGGERADPATVEWAEQQLKVPVIDHWWQTETGWCVAGNPVGIGMLPTKRGSPTVPMPGYQLDVVDEAGKSIAANKMGSLAIKLPLPPGGLPTLWGQDQRFRDAYLSDFPGYYKTSDAGYKDEDGYVFVLGRTDDIINVAGHRLSTGGMEEILASHPDVAECAVVGIKDPVKGEVPCGFLVLKASTRRPSSEIEKEIVNLVREKLGPVAAFKLAIAVDRLPKTRSGKILRGTIKKIADQEQWTMPATIEDPRVLDEINEALKLRGLA